MDTFFFIKYLKYGWVKAYQHELNNYKCKRVLSDIIYLELISTFSPPFFCQRKVAKSQGKRYYLSSDPQYSLYTDRGCRATKI